MQTVGWIAIGLEIVLLLIWVKSIFFTQNGTDPAGKGIAMLFMLGLAAYIGGSVMLLLLNRVWSDILVLVMAGVPLTIVGIGLWKEYGPGKSNDQIYTGRGD